ncbi:MAG: hypothetical protein JW705_09245, partial [Methanosarcinaceae archaeon]|nr:hypothetical protein [Methanosarcinaceae archaeon]
MELETTYGALTLVPPLIAIILSIWKRQAILSLLLGIWVGATIVNNYDPLVGLLETFSYYYVERALADEWNMG